MSERTKLIPRKIWMLWFQGLSEAPFLVRRCIDSWVKENPSWDVVILDESNLSKYVDLDLPEKVLGNLALAHQSDLVRLHLLAQYGGVWADATTFCMKPLDEWIDDCTTSGFFAFYKPARDRVMSNWFMVSEKGCPIVCKLRERLTSFWLENEFNANARFKILIIRLLKIFLNRNEKTAKYWLSPVVTKLLKVYPYAVFHYMFERLVSNDSECQKIWDETKKIPAKGLHKIKRRGLKIPVDEDIKKEIDEKKFPMYKLDWNYNHRGYSSATLLYYLLEGENTKEAE
jgi:hypothetical protein